MELRQLRYFVRIVDLGSLSRAALDLYVAQPALSKHVAALEAELGERLLVRTVRGVTPTDAGLALYRSAQAMLRQVGRIADEVRSATALPTGGVSLGIPYSVSNILTPALVRAVARELPGVRLAITEGVSGVLEGLLATGRLDLGLLYARERPARQVEERKLLVEELHFVTRARPGARVPAEVTLREAAKQRLILPGAGNTTRQIVEREARAAGLRLEIAAEVDSPRTTKALVAAGAGAAVMSRSGVHPETSRPRLALQRIVRPTLARPLNVCLGRGEAPSRAAAHVLRLVEETAAALVRQGQWKGAATAR